MYQVNEIGQIIAARRRELGMTQEQLATLLHITPQAVSKWENGSGLPDLAMLPQIAEALAVSPNVLLGEKPEEPAATKSDVPGVPPSYQGLPLVYADDSYAVYTNKEPETQDGIALLKDGEVLFRDGSKADLKTETVTNAGNGEMRIVKLMRRLFQNASGEDALEEIATGVYNNSFEGIHSVRACIGYPCKLELKKSEDGVARVEATGERRFLNALKVTGEAGGVLRIDVSHNNQQCKSGDVNRITVFCGFTSGKLLEAVLGGSVSADAEPAFERVHAEVSGASRLLTSDCRVFEMQLSGASKIEGGQVEEQLNGTISGASRAGFANVGNAEVGVSGASSFSVDTLGAFPPSKARLTVSGASNISVNGGKVEKLEAGVSGASRLDAKGLVAEDAEFSVSGSGSAKIGWVRGSSVERVSHGCRLTVLKRGKE